MHPETYLENYQIADPKHISSAEVGRNGPAITYKGSDVKTGAPVAITIIPVAAIDPAEHERFEKQAQTAILLDHVTITRTVAFGRSEDSFVFVSEYPLGETVEAWVRANGPMPADAVLRVALQVTAALSAARFYGLTHPAIQPGNVFVSETADGRWPYVQLTHFALAGLKSAPNHPDLSASDYASPEQRLQGTVDFRSEIYSLAATMCFLLTGVFYPAYPRWPQTKRIARPLRALIARTLEDDPELRPQDPALFSEELRTCLSAIERRLDLQRKFGIPFSAVAKPPRTLPLRRPRPTLILAPVGSEPIAPDETALLPTTCRSRSGWGWASLGLLLAAGVVAAWVLPEDMVTSAFHREMRGKTIGVTEISPVTAIPQNPPSPSRATTGQTSQQSRGALASAKGAAQANSLIPSPERSTASTAGSESAPVVTPHAGAAADQAVIASNSTVTGQRSFTQPSQQNVGSESDPAPKVATAQENYSPAHPTDSPHETTVAKNIMAEPAPPAEGPDDNVAAHSSESAEAPHENENAAEDRTDGIAESKAEHDSAPPTSSHSSPSRSKRPATVTRRTGPSRVPRALPAEPDHRSGGTMRARVAGVTPAGNVVLILPNGERAIVSPQDANSYSRPDANRRRPRRVIIERRLYQPPYQQ